MEFRVKHRSALVWGVVIAAFIAGFISFSPNTARAAVALDAASSLAQSATNATTLSLSSFTVGTGSNRALLVELDAAGCTPFPSGISVTWDSGGTNQALTFIASSSNSSDGSMAELWGLVAPTSGNKTLAASWTNNCSGGNVTLAVLSVTGADQTGGVTTFANAVTNSGSGSSWSIAVTSATGDFAVSNSDSQNTVPTPSNQTSWYSGFGSGATNPAGSYANGASTVTFNYGGGGYSGGYENVGVDIVAASSGGGTAPTVTSFSASPSSITLGSSSALSWNTTNASSVSISGNNLSFSTTTAAGSTNVTPNTTGSLIYTLTAVNANGTTTATTSVSVSGSVPTINSFSASPWSITLGSSSALSWNTTNASSVSISGNSLSFSTTTGTGSTNVTPAITGTLTYTLSASNPNGTSTATTSISVSSSGGGGGSPVTLVQSATTGGNSNPVAITFSSAVTAGDTIIVLSQWADNTTNVAGISGITDSLGNHFTVVTSTMAIVPAPDYAGRELVTEISYATSSPGGSDTVTVNFANSSVSLRYSSLIETTASVLDQTAEATGTSLSPSAGSLTSSQNGEFGAAALFQDDGAGNAGNISGGSGWTLYQDAAGGATENAGEYKAQSTAGGITGNFVITQSAAWAVSFALFAPTGGGSSSSSSCDTLYLDACSVNYFIRGDTGAIFGNSASTHFQVQYSGQALAVPIMTSSDFEVTSGALKPVYQPVKPSYTQAHFQWRNDNGGEATATSATAGIEDTELFNLAQNTGIRLRMEIANEGGTIFNYSSQSFTLQYGVATTTCGAISSWTTVGSSGASWGMYNSAYLTDGQNTTNIATSTGGVLAANHTFIASNAGVKDTSSTVAANSVPSDSFMVMEFSINALTSSTPSAAYCFRLTNNGSASNFVYSQYPEVTIASAQSISLSLSPSSITLPSLTPGIAVTGTTTATVAVNGASSGYTLNLQRNSATSTLANASSSLVTFPDYTAWALSGTSCAPGQGNGTTSPGSTFSFRIASSGTTANYCTFWWGSNDSAGTALFGGVPTSTQTILNSTSTASQNGTTTVSIIYRANSPSTQRAGNYSGTVTVTAIANP